MDGAAEPAPAPAAAGKLEKSYFDMLGICCPSEVPLVEKLLEPLPGVHKVSVVVPSRTVIVLHDASAISTAQIGNGPGSVSPCFPSGFPSQTRFSWASESKSVLFLRSTCSVPSSSVHHHLLISAGSEIFVRLLLALCSSGEFAFAVDQLFVRVTIVRALNLVFHRTGTVILHAMKSEL
jgi:copper chaperone CopZ